MSYNVSNVRMAKCNYPYGYKMNGCKTVGVMYADVIDSDTSECVYSGTVANCRGKIEMLGA